MTLYLKSEIQGFIISGSDGHVPLKIKEVVNDVNVYTASSEGCPACCSVHHQMTVTRHQTTWQVQGGHWTRSTWGRLHSLETPSVDLYPSHQKIRFQISLQLQLRHVSGAGPIVRWRPWFMVYGLWAMLAGGHCPQQPPWPATLAGAGTMGTWGPVMLQGWHLWCCSEGTGDPDEARVLLSAGLIDKFVSLLITAAPEWRIHFFQLKAHQSWPKL